MSRIRSRVSAWLAKTNAFLENKYRSYAVLSSAAADFRKNDLRYHTYYFTVNAFIGVLAMFVAVTSLIALLGQTEFKAHLVDGIKSLMPILRGSSDEVLNVFESFNGAAGIISLLFLIWAATRIFNALASGFDIIWARPKRSYAHTLAVGFLMVVALGALFLAATGVLFGFNRLWGEVVQRNGVSYYLGSAVARPVIAYLIDLLLFLLLYRFLTGVKPAMKDCVKAAALAAALFLASQYVLNLYFDYVYKVPLIYGSLASGIVVMLWMQLTGMIAFFGAEVVFVLGGGEVQAGKRLSG